MRSELSGAGLDAKDKTEFSYSTQKRGEGLDAIAHWRSTKDRRSGADSSGIKNSIEKSTRPGGALGLDANRAEQETKNPPFICPLLLHVSQLGEEDKQFRTPG